MLKLRAFCFTIILSILLHSFPAMALYEGSKEEHTVTILYETTSLKGWYGETVYSPICSFDGGVYFVYIGEDFYPYVGVSKDGVTNVSRLSTEDYQVYDDGHHEFSIGVDQLGYLHVTGDMHNFPDAEATNIPEKWENAKQLYWISNQPADISAFTFVGNDARKQMPGTAFSYGFFRTDRNGELFYITRALAKDKYYRQGGRGLALYYYDINTKQWLARGAKAPTSNASYPVLIWEESGQNGGSYQRYKADLLFDTNNRMHLAVSLNKNNPAAISNYVLYAYSDDLGLTFHKADGTQIQSFPIQAVSGIAQGDIIDGDDGSDIGEVTLSINQQNNPALHYKYNGTMYYRYWNGANWSERMPSPFAERIRGFYDETGNITTMYGDYNLYRVYGFENPTIITMGLDARMRYLDYNSIRNRDGFLYGACWNTITGNFKILKIKLKEIPSWMLQALTVEDETVTVQVKNVLNNLKPPYLLVAAYGRDNQLLETNCIKLDSSKTSYSFLFHTDHAIKYKAFLWKDGSLLIPISNALEYFAE